MATNINPDKYIRKAFFDLTNNIVVNSKVIKCFDSRVTGNENLTEYILMTAQTKEESRDSKCGNDWETSILIEIYTKYSSAGNTGSRVLLNDIEQAITDLLKPILIVENFNTIKQNVTFETQLETVTDTENIFRSFLRLNLTLN